MKKKVYYGYRFIYVHSMKKELQQWFSISTQEKLNILWEWLREIAEQYSNQINNDGLITLVYKAACILGFKWVGYHKVTDENTKISQLHKFFFEFQNQLVFDSSFQFPWLSPKFAFNNPWIKIDVYELFNAHQDVIEQKRKSFFERLSELATYIPSWYIKPWSWKINKESIMSEISKLKHDYKLEVLNSRLLTRLQEVEDTGTWLETIADFIIMNKNLKKIQIWEPTIEELYSLLNE
jgi:hypothetical protein